MLNIMPMLTRIIMQIIPIMHIMRMRTPCIRPMIMPIVVTYYYAYYYAYYQFSLI